MRAANITVRVPLDLEASDPYAAAGRMLLDIIEHGISALRHNLSAPWLGDIDVDKDCCIITFSGRKPPDGV